MGRLALRPRHHVGREIHRKALDARRDLADRLGKEARATACDPTGPEHLQPFRLDVEREDERFRPVRHVHIAVWLPAIDKHRRIVG